MHRDSHALTPLDTALLTLVALIWGVNIVAVKYTLIHVPPFAAMFLRFLVAGMALVAYWRPAPGTAMTLAGVAALVGVHFGLQSVGLWLAAHLTPMIIASQLWVPFLVVFSSVALGERMGSWRAVGIALAFGGIVVLAADRSMASDWLAFLFVMLAAALYAAASVLVRRTSRAIHPLAFQAWIAIMCMALSAPMSLMSGESHAAILHQHWTVYAAIVFSGLGASLVANALLFRAIQRYESARTTPFMFLTPIIAIGVGAVVFSTPISAQVMVGGAITLAGVGVVMFADRLARLHVA